MFTLLPMSLLSILALPASSKLELLELFSILVLMPIRGSFSCCKSAKLPL
jgi:hypothetical protein